MLVQFVFSCKFLLDFLDGPDTLSNTKQHSTGLSALRHYINNDHEQSHDLRFRQVNIAFCEDSL
jgi:hypothetical protein